MKSGTLAPFLFGALSMGLASQSLAGDSPCLKLTYQAEGLFDQGAVEKSEETIKRAISLCDAPPTEKSARPYLLYGKLLFQRKAYLEAVPLFEKALKKQPGLGLSYLNLAESYVQLEKWEEAIEAGTQAVHGLQGALRTQANSILELANSKRDTISAAKAEKEAEYQKRMQAWDAARARYEASQRGAPTTTASGN